MKDTIESFQVAGLLLVFCLEVFCIIFTENIYEFIRDLCVWFSPKKSMPQNTKDTKSIENIIYLLSLSLGNSYFNLKEDALAYF